jgi:DNA-binding transcriptional regulator YdaS (Cro superfamily)
MDAMSKAIQAAGGPSKAARCLGLTAQALCFYRDGKRAFPPEHAASLERAGGYRVRRWELFPQDWHRIWPELIGAEGAPEVPEPVTQPGALDAEVRDAA